MITSTWWAWPLLIIGGPLVVLGLLNGILIALLLGRYLWLVALSWFRRGQAPRETEPARCSPPQSAGWQLSPEMRRWMEDREAAIDEAERVLREARKA